MPVYHDGTWFVRPGYWTRLTAEGGHPNGKNTENADQWAVRRWKSTVEGTILIEGQLAKTNTVQGDVVD